MSRSFILGSPILLCNVAAMLCLLASLAVGQVRSGDDLFSLMRRAVRSEGMDYLAAREALCLMYSKKSEATTGYKGVSNDWESALQWDIVTERVERKDMIHDFGTRFQAAKTRMPIDFVSSNGIRQCGMLVANIASNVPMYLIEYIWKTNDLAVLATRQENISVCAYAVGVLRAEQARQPLGLLLRHSSESVRVAAAESLATLGGSRSVQALLDTLVEHRKRPGDATYNAVVGALFTCCKKDSQPLILKMLEAAETGKIDDEDQSLRLTLEMLDLAVSGM